MNFLLHKKTVAFDDNGDPLGYYDIIAWDWNGPEWTFEVIGSASLSPVHLHINKTKIQWHEKNNQVMGHGHTPPYVSRILGVIPIQSRAGLHAPGYLRSAVLPGMPAACVVKQMPSWISAHLTPDCAQRVNLEGGGIDVSSLSLLDLGSFV